MVDKRSEVKQEVVIGITYVGINISLRAQLALTFLKDSACKLEEPHLSLSLSTYTPYQGQFVVSDALLILPLSSLLVSH